MMHVDASRCFFVTRLGVTTNRTVHSLDSIKFPSTMSRLLLSTLNRHVKAAQYAVRGPIVQRSGELAIKLQDKSNNLPFTEIIACNIGNPQSLKQQPLSYIRDVLSILINPSLKTRATFAPDVLSRSTKYSAG